MKMIAAASFFMPYMQQLQHWLALRLSVTKAGPCVQQVGKIRRRKRETAG
jgi:hypothetical protein